MQKNFKKGWGSMKALDGSVPSASKVKKKVKLYGYGNYISITFFSAIIQYAGCNKRKIIYNKNTYTQLENTMN